MSYTRRDFGKVVLGSIPAAAVVLSGQELFAGAASSSQAANAQAAPVNPRGQGCTTGDFNSKFAGVQLGCIVPYSYHGVPSDARSTLENLVQNGINACELMNQTAEEFAGAPARANPFGGAPGRGRGTATPARGAAAARRGPFRPPQLTPAQQAQRRAAAAALTKWRLSVPMSKYEELRRMYAAAGVHIYGFKLQLESTMADAEFDYAFNVAKALGADQLTMEMPGSGGMMGGGTFKPDYALTKRIGQFADRYKIMVGYHAHTEATPTLWDTPMSQSRYNGINLDIGHYVNAGNHDAIAFIRKNHARITSMHLKDRPYPNHSNGNMMANFMWGESDTPLKEALRLMRDQHYTFPAAVELEYPTPKGSNSVIEVGRCIGWAKNILLSDGPGIPATA